MTSGEWRFLQLEYPDARRNLAAEEAIFEAVGEGIAPPTVRLWRNPRTVILGRFQHPLLEVDFEACSRYGVAIVRRFTGGGAVFQDLRNLNWSFFMPNSSVPIDLVEVYRRCSIAIIRGLSFLGVNANYEPPNIIRIGGLKLSGMAACKRRRATLCHGTLLINSDLDILREVLNQTKAMNSSKYIRSKVRAVTNLTKALGKSVSISKVKQALVKGIEEVYGVHLNHQSLLPEEGEKTRRLYDAFPRSMDWVYSRHIISVHSDTGVQQ